MQFYNPRQYVELFHLLFLSQLGHKLDKKLYALKGGCNMRFFLNSIRYSEDIDVDVQIIAKETLQNKIQKILTSTPFQYILQAKDIEIAEMSEPKQTNTTQRWKILLKRSASAIYLPTKIEFSRRSFSKDVIFEPINLPILRQYSLPSIMVNHYSAASMYEQKIQALALRNQTQARDVFDLYLLIHSGSDLKLKDAKKIQYLHQAQSNAMSITFADFKGQVLAYLSEDDRTQYDEKSVWKNIVSIVIESLNEHIK